MSFWVGSAISGTSSRGFGSTLEKLPRLSMFSEAWFDANASNYIYILYIAYYSWLFDCLSNVQNVPVFPMFQKLRCRTSFSRQGMTSWDTSDWCWTSGEWARQIAKASNFMVVSGGCSRRCKKLFSGQKYINWWVYFWMTNPRHLETNASNLIGIIQEHQENWLFWDDPFPWPPKALRSEAQERRSSAWTTRDWLQVPWWYGFLFSHFWATWFHELPQDSSNHNLKSQDIAIAWFLCRHWEVSHFTKYVILISCFQNRSYFDSL